MNNILNLNSDIFNDEEAAYMFLQRNGVVPEGKVCVCGSDCILYRARARISGHFFQCRNNNCKKKYSACDGTFFGKHKVALKEQLKIIFMWVAGFDTVQTDIHLSTTIRTAYKIRDKLVECIVMETIPRIGGEGQIVQLDETAICRGRIISNPSSEIDDIPGVQWIIGGVVTGSPFECFMVLVPNRTAATVLGILERYVMQGSVLRSDGHRSYPPAASNFGSIHQVVPHVEGFRNQEGQTTNEIEGLWASFKHEYKARNGLLKERIPYFISEFLWKKRVIRRRSGTSITRGFYDLISRLNI